MLLIIILERTNLCSLFTGVLHPGSSIGRYRRPLALLRRGSGLLSHGKGFPSAMIEPAVEPDKNDWKSFAGAPLLKLEDKADQKDNLCPDDKDLQV